MAIPKGHFDGEFEFVSVTAEDAGTFCIGYAGVHDAVDHSIPGVIVDDPAALREALFEQL